MKAPITDKSLGINKPYGSDAKFRDVRKKAKMDEVDRHKKFKRTKGIKPKLPKFKIGDEIVLTSGWSSQQFHLAEIIDVDVKFSGFNYFAILKKTTDPKLMYRIGRLLSFTESNWWRTDYAPANVENKNIRWSAISVD